MGKEYHHRPCPVCKNYTVVIDVKLVARQPGMCSLAGYQLKFSCYEAPILECYSCGVYCEGKIDPADGKAVFDPADFVYKYDEGRGNPPGEIVKQNP